MSVVKIKSIESLNQFFDLLNGIERNESRCSGGRYNFDNNENILYNYINLKKYFGDVDKIEIEIQDTTRFIDSEVTNTVTLTVEQVDTLMFKLKKI